MSKFHNAITEALKQNSNDALKAWEYVRQFLEICIATQPIRIHDEKNEGLFYHKNKPSAIIDCSKVSQEEGLSYAIFNSRDNLNLETKIIGFEAYLLRQPEKFSKATTVKCDLVAYNSDPYKLVLTAIEVKKEPENNQTKIEFGMLQAKAYGYLLTRLHAMKYDLLKKHISYCIGKYYKNSKSHDGRIKSISFALAAPKSYFKDSLQKNPQIKTFLEPLENQYFSLGFDGYWVIDDAYTIKKNDDGKNCTPELICNSNQISIFKNFSDLEKNL